MTNVEIMDTLYQMFQLMVRLALPLLLISMIVGIIVAIFQAATQISEQTLTFVPKLLALLVTLSVLGGSMLNSIHEFMILIFNMIAEG